MKCKITTSSTFVLFKSSSVGITKRATGNDVILNFHKCYDDDLRKKSFFKFNMKICYKIEIPQQNIEPEQFPIVRIRNVLP